MTPATAIIEALAQGGIVLTLTPAGKLHVEGPPDLLADPNLRPMLAARRDELAAVLRGDWQGAADALLAQVQDPQAREDLAERFAERLAICAIDGGQSEAEAARIAYAEVAQAANISQATDSGTVPQPTFARKRPAKASEDHRPTLKPSEGAECSKSPGRGPGGHWHEGASNAAELLRPRAPVDISDGTAGRAAEG